MRSGIAPLNACIERGVAVGLGLDDCSINDDRSMLQEMRVALKVHRVPGMDDDVPTPAEIFRMAKERGLVLHTKVSIGYETPWRQVEAMLLQAASRVPDIKREPAPFVHQLALSDFAVHYELNAYTDTPQKMLALRSALHRSVLDVFNEYGIQIMTPFR